MPNIPTMKKLVKQRFKRSINMVADVNVAYSEALGTLVQSPRLGEEANGPHTSSSYLTCLTGTGSTRQKEVGSLNDSTAENTGTFQQLAKKHIL